jgi:methanogenic corrinoid protein MtbC1
MAHKGAEDLVTGLRSRVHQALAAHDRPAAVAASIEAVERGDVDIPTLYDCVLAPLMADVGARWQHGSVRVWEEHLAAAAARTIVEALYPRVRELAEAAHPNGRRVLLTCPPDEAHDLGLRMLSDRFDMAGWTTFYLGSDTPAAEIAAAAHTLGVELVVLTSSTHFHRLRVRALLDELHAAVPGARVVVGGPAFVADTEGFSDEEIMRVEDWLEPADFGAGE